VLVRLKSFWRVPVRLMLEMKIVTAAAFVIVVVADDVVPTLK